MAPVIATLSYHKIGNHPPEGWPTWNYTGIEEFTGHLEWFQTRGWQFISGADFLTAFNGGYALPEKAVLVTFDDAYESLVANALPVLKRFAAPGIVFVPTQFVGSTNLFDNGIEPMERIADWKSLALLEEGGVAVESHGCSHRGFSSLSALEVEQELEWSRKAIKKNLGKDSRMFAFPYGDTGTDQAEVATAILRAGYDLAFLYGGGAFEITPPPSPRFFPRLAMGPGVNLNEMLSEIVPA